MKVKSSRTDKKRLKRYRQTYEKKRIEYQTQRSLSLKKEIISDYWKQITLPCTTTGACYTLYVDEQVQYARTLKDFKIQGSVASITQIDSVSTFGQEVINAYTIAIVLAKVTDEDATIKASLTSPPVIWTNANERQTYQNVPPPTASSEVRIQRKVKVRGIDALDEETTEVETAVPKRQRASEVEAPKVDLNTQYQPPIQFIAPPGNGQLNLPIVETSPAIVQQAIDTSNPRAFMIQPQAINIYQPRTRCMFASVGQVYWQGFFRNSCFVDKEFPAIYIPQNFRLCVVIKSSNTNQWIQFTGAFNYKVDES